MVLSNLENRLRCCTGMQIVRLKRRLWDHQIGVKSASSLPRTKSAPRGSNSTTFVQGVFQFFNLHNISTNPVGVSSVLPNRYPIKGAHPMVQMRVNDIWLDIRCTYKTKLKFEKFVIGGWCVASCTSIQCSKFTFKAWGYAIRYVRVHG